MPVLPTTNIPVCPLGYLALDRQESLSYRTWDRHSCLSTWFPSIGQAGMPVLPYVGQTFLSVHSVPSIAQAGMPVLPMYVGQTFLSVRSVT